SDIIHLNVARQSLLLLSSCVSTDSLLEKHSSVYSDRLVRNVACFGFTDISGRP
ncbi:hypothetical protein B0H11DRAFT_1701154, partial [Mycena galericulata]